MTIDIKLETALVLVLPLSAEHFSSKDGHDILDVDRYPSADVEIVSLLFDDTHFPQLMDSCILDFVYLHTNINIPKTYRQLKVRPSLCYV